MRLRRWLATLPLRLRSLFRRAQVESELVEELEYHIERQAAEFAGRGMNGDAARHAALRALGGVEQRKEECRDARVFEWAVHAARDFRHGARLLAKAPGFAAAAILTVALGIGATSAMFSIVYGVILRPLPFQSPERLVAIWTTAPRLRLPRAPSGAANIRDWRAQNHAFEDIALVRPIANFNLVGEGEPQRLFGARISANLLPVLGVRPLLGRAFTEDEDEIGHSDFVLLSYGLWQRRFGGDTRIVGRKVLLSGVPHEVVGVMGPDFVYPGREFDLWTPLTINPDDYRTRMNYGLLAVARLRPNVTLAQAQAEMNLIAARLERQYPEANHRIGAEVAPLLEDTVAAVRKPLFVLLAAVGALLLIACANLANLLFARALARRQELALRAALGASRARLTAQSVTELLPLVGCGGVLGIAAGNGVLRVLTPLIPADLPRAENIGFHPEVIAFCAAALAAVAVLAGIWPALHTARAGLAETLGEMSRGSSAAPCQARIRDLLVVGQIAATGLLLVGAILLMRSFLELKKVDPGFKTDRVLTAHLAIPRSKYPKDPEVAAFCGRILEGVQALPEVESAGMVNRLPLAGGTQTGGIAVQGSAGDIHEVSTDLRTVTPDYFRTLGIPLLRGRSFTEADDEGAPLVAIIDERLLPLWEGADPVGRRFQQGPGQPWAAVVGVVGHIHHDRLEEDSRPHVYWNYRQRAMDRMVLVCKTRSDPAALAGSIASVVRALDPEQPLYDVRTLEAVVDRSVARRRLQTLLLGVFASMALVLATVGVYGVIAYAVGQRLREFGIRMALGASRREIARMVLRRGAVLCGAGAALGIALSAAAVQALSTLVFNIRPLDPASFAAAVLLLAAAALAACWAPARRAAKADPMAALRCE
jgi:putative ABC transport system permease protein